VVASGRAQHRHVLARLPDPALRAQVAAFARRQGADLKTSIRPPGSPSRRGPHYVSGLVDPVDPGTALAQLAPPTTPVSLDPAPAIAALEFWGPLPIPDPDPDPPPSESPVSRPWRPLPPAIDALLRHGDRTGRYRSTSEVTWTIKLAMVNASWPIEEARAALLDSQNRGGLKDRTRPDYFEADWARAVQHVATHGPVRPDANHDAVDTTSARIRARAAAAVWRGKAGGSDKAVLHAHLVVAERVGAPEYDLSVREVAELAGVTWRTVRRAHERLVTAGWLRRVAGHRRGEATRWLLRAPGRKRAGGRRARPTLRTPPARGREECGALGSLSWTPPNPPSGPPSTTASPLVPGADQDAWRYRAAGKSALQVWHLLATLSTTRALAERLGVTLRAVQKQLQKLERLRLAIRSGRQWRAIPGDLDRVAAVYGIAGEGARQRARHDEERAVYRAMLHRTRAGSDLQQAASIRRRRARRGSAQ
jgi:DNA-binding transcriptional regulator YhcF (GntR family)